MKRTLAIIFLLILCAGSGTVARAACIGASVNSFGAKGDGQTDDTAANSKSDQRRRFRRVRVGGLQRGPLFHHRYACCPGGCGACGAVEGPFDVKGVNPAVTTIAPTILITNASGPFLTLQGNIGSGVTDLLFHYPNQVRTSAAAPNVYPYTILVNNSGKVVRYMVTNAYNFLDIEIGRVWAQDLFIGAFNTGVNVDNANDHVTLRNVLNQVFWDFSENVTYPSTIDAWVLNHGSALVVGVAADLVGPLSVRWATAMRNREGQYRGESRATYHGFVSLQRGP